MTAVLDRPRREIAFQEIAARAMACLPSLLARWLPHGRQRGAYWLTEHRERKDVPYGSMVVWVRSGAWKHYSTDQGGGDPISLYAYLRDMGQGAAARDLAAELGLDALRPVPHWRPDPAPPATIKQVPDPDKGAAKRRAWARDIWKRAGPASGTQVEAYLRSRGITIPVPASIRFAMLTHKESGKERRWPVMVAQMQVIGAMVGIHRTYLAPDGLGKAVIPIVDDQGRAAGRAETKLMLGSSGGAAVRLGPLGDSLAIAEGIETALSVLQLCPGWTVWAGLSAANLHEIAIPEQVRRLVFVADGDLKPSFKTLGVRRVGLDAAQRAAVAHEGRGLWVQLVVPSYNSDVNDLLLHEPEAASQLAQIMAGWLAMPVPDRQAA